MTIPQLEGTLAEKLRKQDAEHEAAGSSPRVGKQGEELSLSELFGGLQGATAQLAAARDNPSLKPRVMGTEELDLLDRCREVLRRAGATHPNHSSEHARTHTFTEKRGREKGRDRHDAPCAVHVSTEF